MKILVCVKRVLDPQVKARVKADESGVDLANVKMTMNPFCENALEEALRLREAGIVEEIIVASVGGGKTQETLRHGLAMGADRAIQVVTEDSLEPLGIAKVLKQIAVQEGVGMVIAGKQAIDDDSNQTAQMLSALLGWSQATYCSEIKIETYCTPTTTHIAVRDSGAPIPEEDRDHIFSPYRVSTSRPHTTASVGLGLSVSRQLARLMDGELTYNHDQTHSIFELSLPANAPTS